MQKNVIKYIYDAISYFDLDDEMNDLDRDYTILLNRYVLVISCIFLLQSSSNYAFFGYTKEALFLFIIFLGFITSYFTLTKLRKNKVLIYCVFLLINSVITYYSSFCGVESGTYLFYFPLLTALPLFYTSKNQFYLYSLLFLIVLSIYVSAIYDFKLFERNPLLNGYEHQLLIINITCVLLFMIANFFYLDEKRKSYYFKINLSENKIKHISILSSELDYLKMKISKEQVTEEDIRLLLESANISDSVFVENFNSLYPDVFNKIKAKSITPLSYSDLKYCGMLKLGLTTKQIAIYTNSTIKSAESKKYRLRKKFEMPLEVLFGNDNP